MAMGNECPVFWCVVNLWAEYTLRPETAVRAKDLLTGPAILGRGVCRRSEAHAFAPSAGECSMGVRLRHNLPSITSPAVCG